ncbi:anaphase-promoting complex subunit 10 [Pyrus ussuriensis x Pyrus communis]|uniref:Anaphase-promoting complex subunit 10 n=1 Tax=Pyrus ussuriensis x Pyrus communis TaxID=2448454 RepID=A0A5N5HJC9_9ROSA|nr:anaphase-promoting complex subunit 10 [Pyrus ussuriensis x Pyrus communis]
MATESSEGEEDAKLTGGNQLLVVDDDLREMGKKAAWSVSSCKAGNGVSSLRDDNLDTYWQSDGAQPHLVNVQFQRKVQLLVSTIQPSNLFVYTPRSHTPKIIKNKCSDIRKNHDFWLHTSEFLNCSHFFFLLEMQLDSNLYFSFVHHINMYRHKTVTYINMIAIVLTTSIKDVRN